MYCDWLNWKSQFNMIARVNEWDKMSHVLCFHSVLWMLRMLTIQLYKTLVENTVHIQCYALSVDAFSTYSSFCKASGDATYSFTPHTLKSKHLAFSYLSYNIIRWSFWFVLYFFFVIFIKRAKTIQWVEDIPIAGK